MFLTSHRNILGCSSDWFCVDNRLVCSYPVRSCIKNFRNSKFCSGENLLVTVGLNWNKCLRVSEASRCLCHLIWHDVLAIHLTSVTEVIPFSSFILSASFAASFASWLASLFPSSYACPWVHSRFSLTPLSSNLDYSCCTFIMVGIIYLFPSLMTKFL